jgi:hypothetical protein
LQGNPFGHGLDKNELLLRRAQGLSGPIRFVTTMANYMFESSFTNHLSHLEGKDIFGYAKQLANCPPNANKDSHHPNHVNFSHPRITIPTVEPNMVEDIFIQ